MIDPKELYIPAVVDLAETLVKDGVKKAMQGGSDDILWVISDDARFYFDTFGLDRTKVLVEVAVALLSNYGK